MAVTGDALLSAGTSIIGGIMSMITGGMSDRRQAKENAKTRAFNLQMAKLQNKWNIEQWNRENKYNSPIEQKNRLEAAGLNASLIGGASSGNASSLNMVGPAPAQPTDYSQGMSARLQGMQMIANAALTAAQTENVKANTRKVNEEASYQATENKVRDNLQHIFGDGATIEEMLDTFTGDALTAKALQEIANEHYKGKLLKFQAKKENANAVIAWIDKGFRKQFNQLRKRLEKANVKIREEEAKTIARKIALELSGQEDENVTKEFESIMNDPTFIKDMPQIIIQLVRFFKWLNN